MSFFRKILGSDSTEALTDLDFSGNTNSIPCDKFLQAIEKKAFKSNKDAHWKLRYAQTCLSGDALWWYSSMLDETTRSDWALFRRAMLARYLLFPSNEGAASANGSSRAPTSGDPSGSTPAGYSSLPPPPYASSAEFSFPEQPSTRPPPSPSRNPFAKDSTAFSGRPAPRQGPPLNPHARPSAATPPPPPPKADPKIPTPARAAPPRPPKVHKGRIRIQYGDWGRFPQGYVSRQLDSWGRHTVNYGLYNALRVQYSEPLDAFKILEPCAIKLENTLSSQFQNLGITWFLEDDTESSKIPTSWAALTSVGKDDLTGSFSSSLNSFSIAKETTWRCKLNKDGTGALDVVERDPLTGAWNTPQCAVELSSSSICFFADFEAFEENRNGFSKTDGTPYDPMARAVYVPRPLYVKARLVFEAI